MLRINERPLDALRQVEIQTGYTKHAEGSVLISMGDTKVLCTATVEESIPSFKKGSGEGWITAEYSMLPRATVVRNPRDIGRLKQNPRSVEIQRLIGRSLRAAVDLKKMGERSITIDCDVIQADGGTRTASITGGFVALAVAVNTLLNNRTLSVSPIVRPVSAISVGIVKGKALLDLCYEEDFAAEVDMNVVMSSYDDFIEIQGTGEKGPFDMIKLNQMLELAKKGNRELIAFQRQALQYDWINTKEFA